MLPSLRTKLLTFIVLIVTVPACGKKGPPLPPLERVPARPTEVSAKRLGSQVVVQFTIPSSNRDERRPADIERVDVYAYTAMPDDQLDFAKDGALVGSIKVRRPPPEPEPGGEQKAPVPPEPSEVEGYEQGTVALVIEQLKPEALRLSTRARRGKDAVRDSRPRRDLRLASPLWWPVETVLPRRYYAAVGVGPRGRKGTYSERIGVPRLDPPSPPQPPTFFYTESTIALAWKPPPDARRAIQGPPPVFEQLPARPLIINDPIGGLFSPVPDEPPLPSSSLMSSPGLNSYNVYDANPKAPALVKDPVSGQLVEGPGPRKPEEVYKPLNPEPLSSPTYEDARLEFGTERCYVIRTLLTFQGTSVEGEPSQIACVTPADVFPPGAPTGLTTVASEGAISLIWEPNAESDLAGYLVLRGEAPGEKLQTLTAEAIRETTYRDTTVQPGVRYVYAVVAVDNATPPNVGAQSNRVEEAAR